MGAQGAEAKRGLQRPCRTVEHPKQVPHDKPLTMWSLGSGFNVAGKRRPQQKSAHAQRAEALSHRGTPKTSSSRQTADDVEPGVRFQRGWQASSATEVRSRSESTGQARPAEANVSERSRRPSSETPSGDFVLRQTDRWPGADAHETPAASPVLGASSVWSPVSGSSASDSMSPPGTAPLRPRVLPGREIGPYIESREASDAELFSWWSEKTTPIGVGGEMESVVDMEVIGFQRGDVSAKPPLAPSCHPPARRPQRGKASEQKGWFNKLCCRVGAGYTAGSLSSGSPAPGSDSLAPGPAPPEPASP